MDISIQDLVSNFNKLVEALPKSLRDSIHAQAKEFRGLLSATFEVEDAEHLSEFKNAGVNSGAKKEEMLDILCGIISAVKNSGQASAEQSSQLDEIKFSLQESIEKSFAKSGSYQTKWCNLLEEARNENAQNLGNKKRERN